MNSTTKSKLGLPVHAIVAMDDERAIGKNGGLAWHLPEDLKNFSKLTKGHTVLMGRKTFDSLPEKFKPLPKRLNLVLSRNKFNFNNPDIRIFNELSEAIDFCADKDNVLGQALWVIGGEQIYTLTKSLWDKVFVTRVAGKHQGDAFFPEFEEDFKLIERLPSDNCVFEVYERK